MLTLTLGPLAFPVTPLLLLASVLLAQQLGAWVLRRDAVAAAALKDQIFHAALLGLLVARLAHCSKRAAAHTRTFGALWISVTADG
ncbi:MAG: hypothetical protein U5L74_06540 [Ideonella sp.]|nr:hypothetical protein [Ideonella sp.]